MDGAPTTAAKTKPVCLDCATLHGSHTAVELLNTGGGVRQGAHRRT
jgi:hypothetical protein